MGSNFPTLLKSRILTAPLTSLSIIDTRGLEMVCLLTESLSVSYHTWVMATSPDLSAVPCVGWRLVPSLAGPRGHQYLRTGPLASPSSPWMAGASPLPKLESPRDSLQALGTELQIAGHRLKGTPGPRPPWGLRAAPGPGQSSGHVLAEEAHSRCSSEAAP